MDFFFFFREINPSFKIAMSGRASSEVYLLGNLFFFFFFFQSDMLPLFFVLCRP